MSYGPGDGAMNPFWSETAREEALLRSMRPLELPAPSDQVVEGSLKQPYYSPPKDMDPVDPQSLVRDHAKKRLTALVRSGIMTPQEVNELLSKNNSIEYIMMTVRQYETIVPTSR